MKVLLIIKVKIGYFIVYNKIKKYKLFYTYKEFCSNCFALEITFFPGVELRTDKGSKSGNLHINLIFSESHDIDKLYIIVLM